MFRPKSDAVKTGYDSIRVVSRNGTSFGPENNQLVFDLTRNIGVADLSNSYLECDATIVLGADSAKHAFNKNCSILSAIRTQSIRSEGRLIEQIDHQNVYANLHYLASQDEGVNVQRQRTQMCMPDYQQVNNPWCCRNASVAASAASTAVAPALTQKVAMPLLGGLFTTSLGFPLLGAPLEIELILDKASHCLHIVDGMGDVACEDVAGSTTLGIVVNGFVVSDSEAYGDETQGDQKNMCANAPWRVGQRVEISGEIDGVAQPPVETTIQSIGISAGNKLSITTVDGLGTIPANNPEKSATNLVITAHKNGKALGTEVSYKLENPRIVISKIIPSVEQTQSNARMMAKGEYTYNITSVTNLLNAIDANVTNSTNIISTDATRAKSILSVPVLMDGVDSTLNDQALSGRIAGATEYQYSISNILRPDRRVNVERESHGSFTDPTSPYPKPTYALGGRPAGLHLYEVEKGLSAANIPVRNLSFLTNSVPDGRGSWLVSRSVGPYGLSENLDGVPVMLYLNYSAPHAANILLHNFIVHVRTINIGLSGVQVFI